MKYKMYDYSIFELNSGKWYLGWWLDKGGKLPEFHSAVFPNAAEAYAKLLKLKSKYKET